MDNFKSFITEQKEESYRFVVIYNDPENMFDAIITATPRIIEDVVRNILTG